MPAAARLAVAGLFASLAIPAAADPVQIAQQAPLLAPGVYQTTTNATRFDSSGMWATFPDPAHQDSSVDGHYTLAGDLITFTSTPSACAQESVRYRFVASQTGFRLHFLEDTCHRAQQIVDIEFVRVH
jgi:hypothetical protein